MLQHFKFQCEIKSRWAKEPEVNIPCKLTVGLLSYKVRMLNIYATNFTERNICIYLCVSYRHNHNNIHMDV
jgi:hypothetical protein